MAGEAGPPTSPPGVPREVTTGLSLRPAKGPAVVTEPHFCESCGQQPGRTREFCGSCGLVVADGAQRAGQTTTITPTPPPPPGAVAPPPPPGAPSSPAAAPTPRPARSRTPYLVGGVVVVVIALVVGVVLLLTQGGGGGKSGPTSAQVAARQAAAQHQHEVDEASTAQTTLAQAWSAEVTTSNANTNQEKSASGSGDVGTARFDFAEDANAVQTLLSTLNSVTVPASVEPDLRSLITAANGALSAEQQAALPNNDFNTEVDAVNQSLTALDSAHDLVVSDLNNITSS